MTAGQAHWEAREAVVAHPARVPHAWRKRLFAWGISKGLPRYEQAMAERKRALLGDLKGTVIEIGPGAGANLPYYDRDIRWIGIEPNPFMEKYIRREAASLSISCEVRAGSAESFDLPDAAADAVVGTLVLCSVADVPRALAEVRRVLRPSGKFVFIEHVAAPAGTRLRRWQQRFRPAFNFLGDGCCPDRETWEAIERAGFADVNLEHFDGPMPVALVRPHIAGVAIR